MKTATELRLTLINARVARPRCPGIYFGFFGDEFNFVPATFAMDFAGIVTTITFFNTGYADNCAVHFDDSECVWWANIEDAEIIKKTEFTEEKHNG